jgi:hypothetical protein
MRILSLALALSTVVADGKEDFDPKIALRRLIEKTKEARSSFERESSDIDSLLQRVVARPSKAESSLVELKSASTLESERRAFEERRSALLQKDSQDVSKKQEAFNQAMDKLRKDTAALVRGKGPSPASFIQVKSKYSDENLNEFYSDAEKIVDQVREMGQSIHSESEVVIDGVHKKILELQTK